MFPAVGDTASLAKTVTDRDIRDFAHITLDHNDLHLDDIAAARSRFGRRVAHGMLAAGLISAVLGTRLPGPGTIYLGQELRFLLPVFIGDTIVATVKVVAVMPGKPVITLTTTVENQYGERVLEGRATVLYEPPAEATPDHCGETAAA